MIVSIMQPAYLPWLGYFDRILQSDLHIVLDSVQLERSSKTRFTNRNKILTKEGGLWLTVPVMTSGIGQPLICDVTIDNSQDWRRKHWMAIQNTYSRHRHFGEHKQFFGDVFKENWVQLTNLLRTTTDYLLAAMNIKTPTLYSSELAVPGAKGELILNLCKAVGGTTYLSGPFGRGYLDESEFKQAGVDVVYHDYAHPVYPQLRADFFPFMSVVDLLFNCGDESLKILNSNSSR